MEPYQLIDNEREVTETQDSWVRLQYEKFRYLLILVSLLTALTAVTAVSHPDETAAQIDLVEEYVEATVKDMLGYYELDKSELGTLEEGLALFPQLRAVYEHVEQRVLNGEVTDFQKKAIQHALNQELWRHFRQPMAMYFAIGEVKSKLNHLPFKSSNPETSLGITDVRANRITKKVYELLPKEVQLRLEFDEEAGHVRSQSLSDALTMWNTTAVDSAILTADIYSAILSAYQEEIDQAAEKGNWTEDQKVFTAYVLACCSSIVDEVPQYGYELLANPEVMSVYWQNVPQVIKTRIAQQEWPESAEFSDQSSQNRIYSIIRETFAPSE
ncbi:MAG: hypothetical protein QG639_590 [Patescibacteria group bacterium]|nr:hypothetical protein [Patescibacteria group bacterium]